MCRVVNAIRRKFSAIFYAIWYLGHDWKFRRVIEKFEVRIEQINYDAVETSSKNLKVNRKSSTRSTSDSNQSGIEVSVNSLHANAQTY